MAIIQTYPTPEKLAQAAAERFAERATAAIADHGHFSVVLAGGSTPQATYAALATLAFAQRINWEKVHIFWGDERCVPPEHADSNYRMAHQTLLKLAPIPANQIYRMPAEQEPKEAAAAYEQTLIQFFGKRTPRFDLVWLGLGTDGHTASLFPDSKALEETSRWVLPNYVRKLRAWRLTLTPALINQAALVVFLVSGQEKAAPLRRVLAGRYDPQTLPAQLIRPVKGQLIWMVDAAASALL